MNEENSTKLYKALLKDYDMGSYDQFARDIQDEGKRKKLYDAIKDDFDLPDFDGFSNQLGFEKGVNYFDKAQAAMKDAYDNAAKVSGYKGPKNDDNENMLSDFVADAKDAIAIASGAPHIIRGDKHGWQANLNEYRNKVRTPSSTVETETEGTSEVPLSEVGKTLKAPGLNMPKQVSVAGYTPLTEEDYQDINAYVPKYQSRNYYLPGAPIFSTNTNIMDSALGKQRLTYVTPLDKYINKAVEEDKLSPSKDRSGMTLADLVDEREALIGKYANGASENEQTYKDAADLNNIDHEIVARNIGYDNLAQMRANSGHADYELNKSMMNQKWMDYYGQQGHRIVDTGNNPLIVYGWEKLSKKIQEDQKNGMNRANTADAYIQWLFDNDPDLEDRFYAYCLNYANESNQPFREVISKQLDELRGGLESGVRPYEVLPDEKEEMAKFANEELDRLMNDIEKSISKRNDAIMSQWKPGYDEDTNSWATELNQDREYSNLWAAKRMLQESREMVDEAMKGGDFMSSSIRGLANSLFDFQTWDFGLTDLKDANTIKAIAKKFNDNPNAKFSKDEQAVLDALALKASLVSYFGKYIGTGYKAGQTTGQAIPFILEMMTGIGESTNALAKAAGKWALKIGEKGLTRLGLKKIIAKTGEYMSKRAGAAFEKIATSKVGRGLGKAAESKTGQFIGKAAAETWNVGKQLGKGVVKSTVAGVGYIPTTGIFKTMADFEHRTTGDAVPRFNVKNGHMELAGFEGVDIDSPWTALGKAFLTQTGEYASEYLGAHLEALTGVFKDLGKKYGMKFLDKIKLGDLARGIGDNITSSDMFKMLADFRKVAHYDGSFNEYLEEVANNIGNAMFVKDLNWGTGENGVFNPQDNWDTYVACQYMSGLFGIPAALSYRSPQYRNRKDVERANDIARQVFAANGKDWSSIADLIKDNSEESRRNLVTNLMQSGQYSQAQKQAALNYAGAVYKSMGMDLGESKAQRSPGDQEASGAYGRGYNMANLANINETSATYQQLRGQMEQEFGTEAVQMIDDDPGVVYSWLRENQSLNEEGRLSEEEVISDEDRQQILDYLNAKMAYEGAVDRINDDKAATEAASDKHIDDRVNTKGQGGDDMIHPVVLKAGDKQVYVTNGQVVTKEDGTVDTKASTQTIFVKDEDGNVSTVTPDDIDHVEDVIDPNAAKQAARDEMQQMWDTDELEDENGEEVGSKKEEVGSGEEDEAGNAAPGSYDTLVNTVGLGDSAYSQDWKDYWAQNPPQDVMDVLLDMMGETDPARRQGWRDYWEYRPSAFTAEWKNNMGDVSTEDVEEALNSREESVESGEAGGGTATAQETPAAARPTQSDANPTYNVGDEVALNVDGRQINGTISRVLADDGKLLVHFDEPVNGSVNVLMTPEELGAMAVQEQAAPAAVEQQPAAQQPSVPNNVAIPSQQTGQPVSDLNEPMPTKEVNGKQKVDYNGATPERAHHHIYNEKGYSQEEADQMVDNTIAAKEKAVEDKRKALEKAQQAKPKTVLSEDTEDEYNAERAQLDANRATAQQELDNAERELAHWRDIKAVAQQSRGEESVEKPQSNLSYQLSDEVDENGRQFVLTKDGNLEFGVIGSDTGLPPAPILLSEGMITNPQTNDGYGLVHIEARHGDQIRKAGYDSVIDFIEEVAKNYEVIREGKNRDGVQTYMLQLTDKHNNTLMVELSGDGTYWNINTAGIFKTSYGANRNVVYNRHTTAKQPAETVEASLSGEQSGTTPSTSMNAPAQTSDFSEGKDNTILSSSQEKREKSSEKNPEPSPEAVVEQMRRERIKLRAQELAEACGIPVHVAESMDEIPSPYREQVEAAHADNKLVHGFYVPKTGEVGEVWIYLPDIDSLDRLDRTYLHESVAHGGLRALLGDKEFNKLCDKVWEAMPDDAKESMANYIGVKSKDIKNMSQAKKREAADEYMAHLSERGIEQSVVDKIIKLVRKALNKLGLNLKLTKRDIIDLLAASRQNLTQMEKVRASLNEQGIQGLENRSEEEIEDMVREHVINMTDGEGLDFDITGIKVIGSRTKGRARPDSDLDVLVEYEGKAREDSLFNLLNDEPLVIDGITVDINPITPGKSGSIEEFMARNGDYDKNEDDVRFSTAWHGSGAEFDEFDHRHMGEGEGAQAYGYGTYVTTVEGIGRTYATALARKNPTYYWKDQRIDRNSINPLSMAYDVVEREGTIKKALALVDKFLDNPDAHEGWAEVKEILKQSKKKDFTRKADRYLYEVDIPDNDGNNYVSWNRTLPKKHRRRIAEVIRALPGEPTESVKYAKYSGGWEQLANMIERNQWAYEEIKDRIVQALGGKLKDEKKCSELMQEAGFVGVEYPAQYRSGGRKDDAKNYVIFNDKDVEITDRMRFSTSAAPTFYSNAANAVENIKQNKATAEQWLAMIKKNGGLKAGEDKWMGLSQWLEDNKGKSLTKDEVQQFIADNSIQMVEVEYGDVENSPGLQQLQDEYMSVYNDLDGVYNAVAKRFVDFVGEMEEKYGDDYYDKMTIQEKGTYNVLERDQEQADPSYNDPDEIAMREMVDRYGDDFGIGFYGDKGNLVVSNAEYAAGFLGGENAINDTRLDYTTRGLDNKREIAFVVPNVESYQEADEIHFGPENEGKAVMWVRFGETTDADGNRVLVIDEIQSNRHQDARERGYASKGETLNLRNATNVAQENYDAFTQQMKDKYNGDYADIYANDMTDAEREHADKLEQEVYTTSDAYEQTADRIPAAPFEKNWHEVAMKRMLRLAAEEDFDKVAWTTGAQQAERYDIGTKIDKIKVGTYLYGGKTLRQEITMTGNIYTVIEAENGLVVEGEYKGHTLTELFGKELGDKIAKAENGQVFEGNDLRIGGEGMKGFYDNILPRFMDKYGKKWGVKTGTVELPNVEEAGRTMHSVDVTPEMKESVMQGQLLFSKSADEERTLMGVHNISEAKLRNALKLGGLANPSMAVINTDLGGFDSFGEISLIPSSDLISSWMGGNAGTFSADAYTPRFPQTYRRLGKGGDKKLNKWIKKLGMRPEMEYNTGEQFNDWYNGFSIKDNALVYPFLHEKGLSGEVDHITHMNVDSRVEDDVNAAEGNVWTLLDRYDNDEDFKKKLTDIVVGDEIRKIKKKDDESFQEFRDRRLEWANQIREALTEEDGYISRYQAEDYLRGQCRGYRENGKFNESRTLMNAEQYIRDHNLQEEYKQYFDEKLKDLGVETMVHAGHDSMGRSKFKVANLEEISKSMKRQGRAGEEGGIFSDSPGAIRAKLLTPMKTLDQIRSKKGQIVGHEAFEQLRQKYNDELREYADRYAGGHIGRLADIITSRDMKSAAREFGTELDADAIADLNDFKKRVKAMPTEYFETKFERPVMLNEFEVAVVPNDVASDIRGALMNAGLVVRDYDPEKAGDREKVTLEAANEAGNVLFSKTLVDESTTLEEANENFNKELDAYESGNLPKNIPLAIGFPKGIIAKVLPSKPIVLRQKVLTKALKKHGLEISDVKNMPSALASPIFIFKSSASTISVLTELHSKDGKNVFVAIELDATKQFGHEFLEVNDVLTVHGREEENIVKPILENDTLAWVDKEKGHNWLSSAKSNSQAITNDDLDIAANIIQDFDNSKFEAENVEKSSKTTDKGSGILFSTSAAVDTLKSDDRVYNDLLGKVFSGVSDATRRGIVADAMENRGYDFGAATEAWLTGLADNGNFAQVPREDWAVVKNALANALGTDADMSDNEARYVLWSAGQIEDGVFSMAADIVKRDELGLNEPVARNTEQLPEESGDDIRFSISQRDRAIARDQYERVMRSARMQFSEAMQDSMLGLKKLMQSIYGNKYKYIEDVPDYMNPYTTENRMGSATQAHQFVFNTMFMKPILDEVGRLCKGKRKERERKEQELNDYLLAKHGLERNLVFAERDAQETAEAGGNYQDAYAENREKDYAGLTALTGETDIHAAEAKAQQMVNDYEAQHDTTELWNRIKAATQEILEKQYLAGMLSKASYEKIRDMFEYYVPLRGWDETTSDQVYGYLTSNAGPFLGGSIVKHAEGRTSKADDPIATIALMGDDGIRAANRNLMKQTFLTFVEDHPSDAVSISDLWLKYNDVTGEWEPVFADIPKDATPEEVEQIVGQFEQDMAQLAQREPDKYKHGHETADIPYRVVPGNEREHQVLVKRNGQTYVLTINGNPRAAQALNGLTNPDVPMGGWADLYVKTTGALNRFLSAVYTTFSPLFVMSNFLRDTGYSNTMVWQKEGGNYALKFHKNYIKYNPVKMRMLFGKWEAGTLDESKSDERLFNQFMLHGGETGFAIAKDLDYYKKKIAKELGLDTSRYNIVNYWNRMTRDAFIGKVGKVMAEQYDLVGRSVENCARFAAFVTSIEMGRSVDRAAYDAKEISVNFNKKGSGGKTYGLTGETGLGNFAAVLSGFMRSQFTFWNAGVQGMTNFGRSVFRHPGRAVRRVISPIFAAGFFAPILAAMMGAGGGDDDDKNAYYNLPEYVRRSNICIYLGGLADKLKGTWVEKYLHDTWLTIPLPVEFRSIYGLGELTYGVISGNERYSAEELAMQYASQFSQLLPIDMLEGGGGFSAFVPTWYKPLDAVGDNVSWSGIPIYKKNPYNENDPEWTKAYSNTSKWLVDATEYLNSVPRFWKEGDTGGDEYKKGWIDWNPANIEYLLKGYLGGAYTFPNDVAKAVNNIFSEDEFEWRNVPFANRVLKQGDERLEARKLKNEYFKLKEEVTETKRLLGKYENAESSNLYDYAKKLDLLNNSKEYRHYQIFEDMDGIIQSYRNAREKAKDPEAIKQYEDLEITIMRQMMNMINDSDKGKEVDSEAAIETIYMKILDTSNDDALLKEARKEYNKAHGTSDSFGSSDTKYNERYVELSKGKDVKEDSELQKRKRNAKDMGDEELHKALKKALDELKDIKKGVHTKKVDINGLGEGDADGDARIMEKHGKRRREILDMSDEEIKKNFKPKKK